MAEGERDPYTGRATTGHEWNGITELTTPVPKIVQFFLALTFISSLIIWVLAPAWPTGVSYTKGILGIDQRDSLNESLEKSAALTSSWHSAFEAGSFDELAGDPAKMAIVRKHGARLFQDNCAMCHGQDAAGGDGFPSLVDDQWLWGGEPEMIMETLRVGINSPHPESRNSEMLAYGRLGILSFEQTKAVAHYVLSRSNPNRSTQISDGAVASGGEIFEQQCTICHGADAKGMKSVGAPNLTDSHWIYGGEIDNILQTLREGRKGVMPFWEDRLREADRKILTLYVLDLAQPQARGTAP